VKNITLYQLVFIPKFAGAARPKPCGEREAAQWVPAIVGNKNVTLNRFFYWGSAGFMMVTMHIKFPK
jgi:hypothetical protein